MVTVNTVMFLLAIRCLKMNDYNIYQEINIWCATWLLISNIIYFLFSIFYKNECIKLGIEPHWWFVLLRVGVKIINTRFFNKRKYTYTHTHILLYQNEGNKYYYIIYFFTREKKVDAVFRSPNEGVCVLPKFITNIKTKQKKKPGICVCTPRDVISIRCTAPSGVPHK